MYRQFVHLLAQLKRTTNGLALLPYPRQHQPVHVSQVDRLLQHEPRAALRAICIALCHDLICQLNLSATAVVADDGELRGHYGGVAEPGATRNLLELLVGQLDALLLCSCQDLVGACVAVDVDLLVVECD